MNTLDSSRIMNRKYLGCFSHQVAGIFSWTHLGLSGTALNHRFPGWQSERLPTMHW